MDSRFAPLLSENELRTEAIHGAFVPTEIRRGERFFAWFRQVGHKKWHELRLWRMSPFGIEIQLEKNQSLPTGPLEVRLQMGEQELELKGRAVLTPWQERGRVLSGIHFERYVSVYKSESEPKSDTRADLRFSSHAYFFPTGVSKSFSRLADNIHFRVINISSAGLLLALSLRNKTLMPGLVFDSTITFPGGTSTSCRFEVKHCQVQRESVGLIQHVGVRILNPSRRLLACLGQYVFAFGHNDSVLPTPKVLRDAGLILNTTQDGVEYDYVRNEDEYQQVLDLRAMALHSVPSLKATVTKDKMRDEYDERSRIMVARFRNKVIGTLRVTFHQAGDKFEDERYCTFPADLPPREEIAEASRAATHPDFRGTDVFANLVRFGVVATLQGGRRYVVQGTFDGLVPIYKRFGFKELGVTFDHPNITGYRVHLLGIDLRRAVEGGINPLVWNLMVPRLRKLMPEQAQNWTSSLRSPWLALYRTTAPLAHLLERVDIFRREQTILRRRTRKIRDERGARNRRGSSF